MSKFNLLARACALGALSSLLTAQEAPALGSFKIGGGSLGGDVKKALDFGATFSFSIESAFNLNERSSLVGGLGYRYYSGANKLLSYIPVSVPATGLNPTIYETRNRRLEAKGPEVTGLYRYSLMPQTFYIQGGLRLGFNKTAETDTGTQLVTDGAAISNTGSISNAHILAVNTINSMKEKKTVAVGAIAGVGCQFLSRYATELNIFTTKIETASGGVKNGYVAEVAFSVQF